MSDKLLLPKTTFSDLTIRAREADGPLRVEADVSCARPGESSEDSGIVPYVTIWYDAPAPVGGGFSTLSIAQARRLADALIKCADHAQRAKDEAERRGWKLDE